MTDDNYYRKYWSIPDKFVGLGGVLLSMTRKDDFAYHDALVGVAWSWRGNYSRMVDYFLRAIPPAPTRYFGPNHLAWYYAAVPDATLRDGAKAVKYGKLAVQLFPDSDDLDTLACAYAQAGAFDSARATEADALKVGYMPFGLELDLVDHMLLFRRDRTCRDPNFSIDLTPFRPGESIPRIPTVKEVIHLQ